MPRKCFDLNSNINIDNFSYCNNINFYDKYPNVYSIVNDNSISHNSLNYKNNRIEPMDPLNPFNCSTSSSCCLLLLIIICFCLFVL